MLDTHTDETTNLDDETTNFMEELLHLLRSNRDYVYVVRGGQIVPVLVLLGSDYIGYMLVQWDAGADPDARPTQTTLAALAKDLEGWRVHGSYRRARWSRLRTVLAPHHRRCSRTNPITETVTA